MKLEEYCQPIDTGQANALPDSVLEHMYLTMLRIRRVEENVADLVEKGEIVCPCHLYIGQEAIATGVCSALDREDYVFSTHRSHGHYLAKGGGLKPLIAEIYGRATGCSKGHGGSMHLVSTDIGFLGSSAIVGGSIPLAVGSALASQAMTNNRVAVSFFGDGAATEGVLFESLNFAALKNLPVIFICENNLYSTHMPISSIQASDSIFEKAQAFGLPSCRIDGNNVVQVYETARTAVERARSNDGPTFIECITYRWRGHVGPNWDIGAGLRQQDEVDRWVEKCPVKRMEEFLLEAGKMTPADRAEAIEEIEREIQEAIIYAKDSPFPDDTDYRRRVFK